MYTLFQFNKTWQKTNIYVRVMQTCTEASSTINMAMVTIRVQYYGLSPLYDLEIFIRVMLEVKLHGLLDLFSETSVILMFPSLLNSL